MVIVTISVVVRSFRFHLDGRIIEYHTKSKSINDARVRTHDVKMAYSANIQKVTFYLVSTRVNIEKNNFLRDYFISISLFYSRISL